MSYPLSQARSLEQDALMTVAILRRRINAGSSPIYRLPIESLAMVASYLDIGDLLIVIHVSWRWRAALFSFPTLWSNIRYGNDGKMLAMLEWSKSVPIRVSVESCRPSEEVTSSLYDNSARIVSLKSDNRTVLRRLLTHPLTSLKMLSIKLNGMEAIDDIQDLADEPTEAVPSLRALSVGGNTEGLRFCVPHLTHFKFYGWYSPETDGGMLLSILGVFRQCPMLEVVDVGWGEALYDLEDSVFAEEDVISLPRLRYLAQEQYVQIDQPWLPDLLHLPKSCSIYLKKPPIAYSLEGIGPLCLPFLYKDSSYLSDIRCVKLGMVYDYSRDAIETFMEIVNGQGILLSFRTTILLGGLDPGRDQWTVAGDEISASNLCALRFLDTGSPMVLCLESYQVRGERGLTTYVAQGLEDLENVTTLILSNSAVEPCLVALEPDNLEGLQWCSTVHSLVIYSPTHLDPTGTDILQRLLEISKKRKTAGAPFRSVTLVIPSITRVVSPDELAALNECVERFEFLTGDGASDWDVDRYFRPNYDPLQRRGDEFPFDAIRS